MPHPVCPPPLHSLHGGWEGWCPGWGCEGACPWDLPLYQQLRLSSRAPWVSPTWNGSSPSCFQFQSVECVIPCDLGSSHSVCDLGWANLVGDATWANLRIIRKVNASCALMFLFSLSPLWACWGALSIFLSYAFLLLGKCVCMKSDTLSAWSFLLERGIQNMTGWYHCEVKGKNVREVHEHRATQSTCSVNGAQPGSAKRAGWYLLAIIVLKIKTKPLMDSWRI